MSNQLEAFVPRQDRVREHTSPVVNDKIDTLTNATLAATLRSGPEAVQRRLVELDREWDVDRALMVNFAVVGGAALAAGLVRYTSSSPLGPRRKGFLYFFGTQLAFLLVHGVVGWCPPLVLFRRLGIRTKAEIEGERHVLLQHAQPLSSLEASTPNR